MDANVIVRNAARKILGSVKLPKLQMFKSAVDGLIAGLEKNPEVCCTKYHEVEHFPNL
jgi:integrator complex subunit 4